MYFEIYRFTANIKNAKVGNRDYYFCCEYCYLEWLKMGIFRY